MDLASPCVVLASCHSPGIGLLKIIHRQQRGSDEYPSLHSFAFLFWHMGLGGLMWPHSRLKGLWEPSWGICLSPATPPIRLENLHQGARPSFVSFILLSWQWETAHSHGADPATDCPDGLGHIPESPLPPASQGTPLLMLAGREPCICYPCCLHGFRWGFFLVLFGFFSRLGKQAGGGGQWPCVSSLMRAPAVWVCNLHPHTCQRASPQLLLQEVSQLL